MQVMLNIVLFGPPGAGKGTQSQYLIDKYKFIHLSTGDLLRSEISNKTELGLSAQEYMNKGELVPDQVVIGMINNKVKENTQAPGFIFDGFPRTVAQAEALDAILAESNITISGMIALEVEEEELVKRLLLRGATSGRPDDQSEELIRRRVVEYNQKTRPVADYYNGQGKFTAINGIGEIDQIFHSICQVVDSLKK
jgi:adenylate kinase